MTASLVKIIFNPYAGRWRAKKKLTPLKAELHRQGIAFELSVTRGPQHALELAYQAVEVGFKTIVAAGGDSTINETVNGFLLAAADLAVTRPTLGIIPLGTANDLADMLHLPRSLNEACARLKAGLVRQIDVCQVNERFFLNNSAIGLEALASQIGLQIQYVKGSLRYAVAGLQAISQRPTWQAYLQWPEGSYRGPLALVSVGNSPRTGGFFWFTPHAQLDDGRFDFVFTPTLSRGKLLRLLPRVLNGSHIQYKTVVYLQTTALNIHVDPTPCQVDGDLLDAEATLLKYRVWPKYLNVII